MKKSYIHCRPLELLISQKRIPMLFIGSGLSKRYLKKYPNWYQLIVDIASQIGIKESQILAMRQEITDKEPSSTESEINKIIGSRLTEALRSNIASGIVELKTFFTDKEINRIKQNDIPFIKMLIAQKFQNYELCDSIKIKNEFSELKKLQNHIGVVITTNYDTFLEKMVFNNFMCYSEQSQYYMSETDGIGEIYKIHGSITSPSTMVFNKEDYEKFDTNLRVIAAKILTLMLDYPLIFLGYSLEDENVLNLLYTLLDCLTPSQLSTLSNRLIYVTWKEGENDLICSKQTIHKNGKMLTLTNIETDNYYVIYKYLQKFNPVEKPERVRKYKQMIRKLLAQNASGEKTLITTEEDLEKLGESNKLVIAFGSENKLAKKGVMGLKVSEVCDMVLNQQPYSEEDAEELIKYFYVENSRIAYNHFVPIFYFTKICGKYNAETKTNTLKKNTLDFVKKLVKNQNIDVIDSAKDFVNKLKEIPSSKQIKTLIKSYAKSKITYKQYIEIIKEIKNKSLDFAINESELRKAITYADLK